MLKEESSSCTSKTLKQTVNSICKYCGKAAGTSTASSKVSRRLRRRIKEIMELDGESVKWSSEAEYEFVDTMYDEVLKGNEYTTTSFSPMVWYDMKSEMFDRTGAVWSMKKMIGKHDRLKKTWRKYNELMHASAGMVWNVETNLPQAEPIIWEELAKKNQEFLELRYKRFPHYLKLDVVFSGRASTSVTARASTQRHVLRLQQSSHTEDENIDVRSLPASTPNCNNTRMMNSGASKRKAVDQDVMVALVTATTNVLAQKAKRAKRKESWSIEEVIKVLKHINDLGSNMFNLALRHFQIESHRRTFMALSTEQRRSYILFNLST